MRPETGGMMNILVQYSPAIRKRGLCRKEDGVVCLGMLLEAAYKDLVEKKFVVTDDKNFPVFK